MVPRCLAGARELATTPALAERDLVNFPPRQVFPFLLLVKHVWLNCFISSEAHREGTREGADLPCWVVRRPLPQDWCDWPLHGSLRSLHIPCFQGIVYMLTLSLQVLSLYLSSTFMISSFKNWLHPGILRHGARLLRGHWPRHRHDLPYQDTGPCLHRGVSAWTRVERISLTLLLQDQQAAWWGRGCLEGNQAGRNWRLPCPGFGIEIIMTWCVTPYFYADQGRAGSAGAGHRLAGHHRRQEGGRRSAGWKLFVSIIHLYYRTFWFKGR